MAGGGSRGLHRERGVKMTELGDWSDRRIKERDARASGS